MSASSSQPDLLAALSPATRRNIDFAYRKLKDAGFECYLVGGAVRDLLLGRPAGDIDLTTNARPETVVRLFRRTIPTGLQHGTITVLLPDQKPRSGEDGIQSESFEVTTYRAESDYSDARHPDRVEFAETLADDLSRRDFTVNAIACDPGTGEVVDLFDGLEDLQNGLLRTIGSPEERFHEDGLRTIRACRFAATLEFDLEAKTEMALRNRTIQERTARVAVERFSEELWKGFRAPAVSRMIRRLEESELLYLFFPDRPAASSDAVCRSLDRLAPAGAVMRMALWWRELNYTGDRARNLARKLKFSNKHARDIEWFQRYFDYCDDPGAATGAASPRDSRRTARVWLSGLKSAYATGEDALEFLDQLAEYPTGELSLAELRDILKNQPLVVRDLAVNGGDLMKIGMSGPAIGENLRYLLDLVLTDPARNTRELLLEGLERRRPES